MKHTLKYQQSILKYQQFIFVLSLAAFVYMWLTASWVWITAGFLYYKFFVGLIGNQVANHRYFSHNSFSTSRFKHYFLYFASLTTGVNPVYYANAHRHHHLHSDQPNDVHSPQVKLHHIFTPLYGLHSGLDFIHISAILDRPQRKINQYWAWIFLGFVAAGAAVNWKIACYVILPAVIWNYIHMIVLRIWLAHWPLKGSYRNFDTNDQSYNHRWIHYFDLGEGLHNNHHRFPNQYNQAILPGEFDFAGVIVEKFFIKQS